MKTLYIIVDGDGQKVTDGVQEHEVSRVAQRCADRLGATVWAMLRDDQALLDMGEISGDRYDPSEGRSPTVRWPPLSADAEHPHSDADPGL